MNKTIALIIVAGLLIIPTVLYLRPESEPMVVIAVSTGFTIQMVTLVSSLSNKSEVKEVKKEVIKTADAVNGHLARLVASEKGLSLAEGQAQGKTEGRAEANARTDELKRQDNEESRE